MPKGGSNIAAGLEDTLHRILDNGGNAELSAYNELEK